MINPDVETALQGRLRPKIAYGNTVKLIAVESLDVIFFEKNVTVDVRTINECMQEELTPSARRCPGEPIYTHARSELWLLVPKPSSKIRNPTAQNR